MEIRTDLFWRLREGCGAIRLALLVRNRDRVLTHQYLLTEVWGPSSANEPHHVRVFMANLRKKLEKKPS